MVRDRVPAVGVAVQPGAGAGGTHVIGGAAGQQMAGGLPVIVTRFSVSAASAAVTGVRVAGSGPDCAFAMWQGCSVTASPGTGRPAGTADSAGFRSAMSSAVMPICLDTLPGLLTAGRFCLAALCPSWGDQLRLLDGRLRCRAAPPGRPSAVRSWADYGYCAAHSGWSWA